MYQPGNMTHLNHEDTRVATFYNDYKELSRAHHTLVLSSTRKSRRVVRGWPEHYLNAIREVQWGVIQLSDCQIY
jgi:hypothetical protein